MQNFSSWLGAKQFILIRTHRLPSFMQQVQLGLEERKSIRSSNDKGQGKELNEFKWISVLTEMEERAPDVVDFLSAVALPNVKADDSQVPRICTAYGVLMNTSYCKM